MTTYQFKTNIRCEGCVAKITPYLQAIQAVDNWQVDLQSPERRLTVRAADNTNINELVTQQIKKAGYQIEQIQECAQ